MICDTIYAMDGAWDLGPLTPQRLSILFFLFPLQACITSRKLIGAFLLSSLVLLGLYTHRPQHSFREKSLEIILDRGLIISLAYYNIFQLISCTIRDIVIAFVFAFICGFVGYLRTNLPFRHPVRDGLHCILHFSGAFGTYVVVMQDRK